MDSLLIAAISFITCALIFYTVGVFGEKKQGTLKIWHAVIFWMGFVCDTTGTSIMGKISGSGFRFNLHGMTGLIALLLMAFHAVWATVILAKKDGNAKKIFHKFSIAVWAVWLIPYIVGVFMGMSR